jgi:membrane-associated protease RseP (regulator of RpoE activity)
LLTSIVAAAVILAVLIVVHEAGHFAMAKRLGVRVIRFSIGYPPKIWGMRRGETEYSLGLTPFGGYVRMLGEEVGEEPRSEEMQNYVHELALDVLEAAENYRWSLPSKDPDQKILALAKRLGTSDARVPEVIGHEMTPEQADVMH